jgi:hypothetical protein
MFAQYLLAALAGLACGVVNGGYLLLVLYATAAAKGIWHNLLVVTWPVHGLGSIFLVIFVVSHPIWTQGGWVGISFILPWGLLTGGALVWYLQTHPNPLRWRRRNRQEFGAKRSDTEVRDE